MAKAIVFGAKGQLGVELSSELTSRGYEVLTFPRGSLDITNAEAVEIAIAGAAPDFVYNAAAYNMVDVAEKEAATALQANALGVRNIAMACRQSDVKLVHFSTDYVFDGTLGRPYVEEDVTHPLGAYAVSKLAGELFAQAYLDDPLIVRTSGVFGPGALRTARGNFPEVMMRLAREGKPLRVVEDHVASPTYAPALATKVIELAEGGHRGIFHVGGGEPVSWFAFAKMVLDAAGLQADLQPTDAREYRTAARRPKYSALENKRLATTGLAPMPPLAQTVADYMESRKAYLT